MARPAPPPLQPIEPEHQEHAANRRRQRGKAWGHAARGEPVGQHHADHAQYEYEAKKDKAEGETLHGDDLLSAFVLQRLGAKRDKRGHFRGNLYAGLPYAGIEVSAFTAVAIGYFLNTGA